MSILVNRGVLKPLGRPATQLEWPSMLNQDYHLRLKRKIYGAEGKYPELRPPHKRLTPATVLHEGTPAEAGMKPDVVATIDAACEAWVKDAGIGFNLCVARHGVIVVNKGYGKQAFGPHPDDPQWRRPR